MTSTFIIGPESKDDSGNGVQFSYLVGGDFNRMRTFKRHLAGGHRVSSQSNRIWHTAPPWKGHTVRLEGGRVEEKLMKLSFRYFALKRS